MNSPYLNLDNEVLSGSDAPGQAVEAEESSSSRPKTSLKMAAMEVRAQLNELRNQTFSVTSSHALQKASIQLRQLQQYLQDHQDVDAETGFVRENLQVAGTRRCQWLCGS